ncbi:RNA chaperone Hfq [Sphingomicrobium astaxanthinifaciens]|uniref:RNA chaperone Hfq n=1 Tax=Sphingomicrobium astaxanthinifaciens TaxID=1227949 RepID=UPI001FCB02C3|nr:RNA chaperone Hfq [Sphingomicrobium astaxanthinifaciens]MCJ7422393.1 RNA chaperone Hfq [Sphingomicrobium astaxanthinifaciens]
MPTGPSSLQDQFLNLARKGALPVTLFLLKGVRLQGLISGFDAYSLTLTRGGEEQLVYKQGVSTILLRDQQPFAPPAPPRGDRQADFLRRRLGQGVRLHLVNGIALEGRLAGHGAYALLLEQARDLQLVFKHAIATVADAEPGA